MAHRPPRLVWYAPRRCWRARIRIPQTEPPRYRSIFCGCRAAGPDDARAYAEAVREFEQRLPEIYAELGIEDQRQPQTASADSGEVAALRAEVAALRAEVARLSAPSSTPPAKTADLAPLIERYQTEQQQRGETEQQSSETVRARAQYTAEFADWLTGQSISTAEALSAQADDLLLGYRRLILQSGRSKSGQRQRLIYAKQLAEWLYRYGYLSQAPRCLGGYAQIKQNKSKPQHFSPHQLKRIISMADDRVKVFVLASLNCGLYEGDFQSIECSEIDRESRTLNRERNKSGIYSSHKLWETTFDLLVRFCDAAETDTPFAFGFSNISRMTNVSIKAILGDDCSLRAKHLRHTGAQLVEDVSGGNSDLASRHLAHADGSTARHYRRYDYSALHLAHQKIGDSLGL